ncbi:BglG family transcription antiterminator [Virgibacillus flavescens]|uniref:BglG family transcription antiterminator n=1 Tax=Virgibacillus flavescens TaxID=1611422 RepID=UPI003D329E6D
MYISGRERKLIELLLDAQVDITVKEIARSLEVSERTVHRDLGSIEHVIFEHNLELFKKSGVGLRIIGNETDKLQLKQTLSKATSSDYTSEERQTIILTMLLEAKEPMKLFTLAHELNVTNATISHDLDDIERELEGFQIDLVRKRGYGVKIEGKEANKRASISYLISKHVDPFDFVSILKENIENKPQASLSLISNRLLGLVNPDTLHTIEKRVELARSELPHELADSAFIGLVVHLALAIERLQKGEHIKFDKDFMKQIEGTTEYEVASRMIHDLEDSFSMTIPDDEIGYITMHLLGAKLRVDHNYLIEDSSLDIAYKTKELIDFVGKNLGVDLSDNASLFQDLIAHLKPTIYRLNQGMNITNPLIKDITKDYADLFHLIQDGVEEIFPDMEFPRDEAAYLVLHFAAALLHGKKSIELRVLVICASGIGTAKMLATNLIQRIPEINEVENKSLFDLKNLDLDQFDIIVSTVPLKNFSAAYIQISPILTESEVHRLKKVVRQKKLTGNSRAVQKAVKPETESQSIIPKLKAMERYSKVVLDLLTSFYVKNITEKKSTESLLYMICESLQQESLIENKDQVMERLLKREQIGGLGIPKTSLALFHTRTPAVEKPSFTLYSLDYPVTVMGMDSEEMKMDTILLMLAPENAHQEMLEVLSFLSGTIIQEKDSISLFESADEEKIEQFLSDQFQQFLQEKNF